MSDEITKTYSTVVSKVNEEAKILQMAHVKSTLTHLFRSL